MVQCMAFDCRTVALKQRALVPGLQYVILWRYENEITQTEQKGYRSQRNYRDSVYFSSLLDMGRYNFTGPRMRNLCTDDVPGITLKGE